jgi:hypothetical protein
LVEAAPDSALAKAMEALAASLWGAFGKARKLENSPLGLSRARKPAWNSEARLWPGFSSFWILASRPKISAIITTKRGGGRPRWRQQVFPRLRNRLQAFLRQRYRLETFPQQMTARFRAKRARKKIEMYPKFINHY